MIKVRRKKAVGKYVEIDSSTDIDCVDLTIGRCSQILHDVKITGNKIKIGEYVRILENTTIGNGKIHSRSPYSNVTIGHHCLICQGTIINNAREVTIGSDVGIGRDVHIWTHGGWLGVLDGYPDVWAPVNIGSHVWLASKTTILAGVTIGDHVVIGNHSLVNKDVPSGCFAAGVPCRVVKKNCFPKKLSNKEKMKILSKIIEDYKKTQKTKGFEEKILLKGLTISFGNILFDCETMSVTGELDEKSEDFRDHLRRHGVKFYTGKQFKSVLPIMFEKNKRF